MVPGHSTSRSSPFDRSATSCTAGCRILDGTTTASSFSWDATSGAGRVERLIYLPPVSVGRLGKGDETIRVTVARVRGGRFRRRPRFVKGLILMWPTLWRFEKPVPLRVRALSNPTFAIKAEVCSSYLAKIPLDGNNMRRARSTPVDPAGGHRYGSSLKTCESRGARPRRTAQ